MTMVLRSFSRPSEPVSDIRKVRRARTTWSNHACKLAGIEKFHSGASMTSRSVASSSAISCSEPARARTWFASRLSASVKLAPIQVRSGSATPVDTSRRIVGEVGSIRLAFAIRWSPSLRLSEFSPRGLVCTLRIFMTLSICVRQVDDFVQAESCPNRVGSNHFRLPIVLKKGRGGDGHDNTTAAVKTAGATRGSQADRRTTTVHDSDVTPQILHAAFVVVSSSAFVVVSNVKFQNLASVTASGSFFISSCRLPGYNFWTNAGSAALTRLAPTAPS